MSMLFIHVFHLLYVPQDTFLDLNCKTGSCDQSYITVFLHMSLAATMYTAENSLEFENVDSQMHCLLFSWESDNIMESFVCKLCVFYLTGETHSITSQHGWKMHVNIPVQIWSSCSLATRGTVILWLW